MIKHFYDKPQDVNAKSQTPTKTITQLQANNKMQNETHTQTTQQQQTNKSKKQQHTHKNTRTHNITTHIKMDDISGKSCISKNPFKGIQQCLVLYQSTVMESSPLLSKSPCTLL